MMLLVAEFIRDIWSDCGRHTGNNRSKLESGGVGTLEQLDRDGASVVGRVVPLDGVGRASRDGLILDGDGDGIEASGLSEGSGDPGEEGSGGDGDLHFG